MNLRTEVSGPPIDESISERWIFDRIEQWSRRFPDRCAFVVDHADSVEEYSYTDVLRFYESIAGALKAQGIGRGDRVGILMENIPQWVFALLGAMRLGAVTVPLATTLPENSIRLVAEHAGCKLICADDVNWQKASDLASALKCQLIKPSASVVQNTRYESNHEGNDTALLIYTSGTTGNPKGVELTFDNLAHEIRGAIEALRLTPEHRILSIL